jgi:hypothetical protein
VDLFQPIGVHVEELGSSMRIAKLVEDFLAVPDIPHAKILVTNRNVSLKRKSASAPMDM